MPEVEGNPAVLTACRRRKRNRDDVECGTEQAGEGPAGIPKRRETMDTTLDMHNRVTARELEHVMRLQLEALAGNPALAKELREKE